MKQGFTLVELLAVLCILGILGLIAIPTIDNIVKKNRQNLYDLQVNNIKDAAKNWGAANLMSLPVNEGESITITLMQLKQEGMLEMDIKDPSTQEKFPNNMTVTITKTKNNYDYQVNLESGTPGNSDLSDVNAPILILKGEPVVYLELKKDTYTEKGVFAKDNNGAILAINNIVITKNGIKLTSIDTSKTGRYQVTYSAINDGIISSISRTVVVRDTIKPTLSVPDTTTISSSVTTFDLMEGVEASDLSEQVEITTSGNLLLGVKGSYTIVYQAVDGSGNKSFKNRIIIIE